MQFLHNTLNFLIQRPVVLLLLMALPLLATARFRSVYPSRVLLGLFGVITVASLSIAFVPVLGWAILLADIALLIACLIDLVSLPGVGGVSVTRETVTTSSLGKPHRVGLELVHRGRRGGAMTLRDDLPESFATETPEFSTMVAASDRVRFDYQFVSHQRGAFSLPLVHLRWDSRWRLWQGYYQLPVVKRRSTFTPTCSRSPNTICSRVPTG